MSRRTHSHVSQVILGLFLGTIFLSAVQPQLAGAAVATGPSVSVYMDVPSWDSSTHQMTFTYKLSNQAPIQLDGSTNAAQAVLQNLVYPAGFTFVSSTGDPFCLSIPGGVQCVGTSVQAGQTKQVSIVMQAPTNYCADGATASADVGLIGQTNSSLTTHASQSVSVPCTISPSVSITKTGNTVWISDGPGAGIAYDISITNNGPVTADQAVIQDIGFDPRLTYYSMSTFDGGPTCMNTNSGIQCLPTSLAPGQTKHVQITFTAGTACGPVNNTATVALMGQSNDPAAVTTATATVNYGTCASSSSSSFSTSSSSSSSTTSSSSFSSVSSDSSASSLSSSSMPAIGFSKTASYDSETNTVNYTLTVQNNDTVTLSNIVLQDFGFDTTLGAFQGATGSITCLNTPSGVQCIPFTLTPGQTAVSHLAFAQGTACGQIQNSAQIHMMSYPSFAWGAIAMLDLPACVSSSSSSSFSSSSFSSSSSSAVFDGDVTLAFGDASCATDESTTEARSLSIPFTLHNIGGNASNVGITDFSAHTSLQWVGATNISCPGANHDTCTAGPLAAGDSITGFMNFLVPDGAGNGQFQIFGMGQGGNHPGVNEYVCGGSSSSSSTSSSSSSSTTSSSSSSSSYDVDFSKVGSYDSEGNVVTYTITIHNNEESTVSGLVVQDLGFDPGLTFQNATGDILCMQVMGGGIQCAPFSVGAGQTATETLTFNRGTACGTISNTANLHMMGEELFAKNASVETETVACSSSSSSDSSSSDSSSSSSSTCGGIEQPACSSSSSSSSAGVNLSFWKEGSYDSENNQMVYQIHIENNGSSTASNLVVQDLGFDPQLTFAGASGDVFCSLGEGGIQCAPFSLGDDSSKVITLKFNRGNACGDLHNTASLVQMASEYSAEASTEVAAPACVSSSSSSAPSIQTGEAPDNAGSHRGHDTNVAYGLAGFLGDQLANGNGGVAPGGFGGTNNSPFSPDEVKMLCSILNSPFGHYADFEPFYYAFIADKMGRSVDAVTAKMHEPHLCDAVNAAMLITPATTKLALAKTVQLDAQGYVVTSNAFWNKCFRNDGDHLTFADYMSNTQIGPDGFQMSCGQYKQLVSGAYPQQWTTPGGLTFLLNRATMTYQFPEGYVGVKASNVAKN